MTDQEFEKWAVNKNVDWESMFIKSDISFFNHGWQACAERKNVAIEQLEFNIDEYKRLTREIDSFISDDPAKQASLCDLVEPIKQLKDKCEQKAKELEALRGFAEFVCSKSSEGILLGYALNWVLLCAETNGLIDKNGNPTKLLTGEK